MDEYLKQVMNEFDLSIRTSGWYMETMGVPGRGRECFIDMLSKKMEKSLLDYQAKVRDAVESKTIISKRIILSDPLLTPPNK